MLVGYDRPTTIGLNLRSLGFGISIYSDFCVPTAFFVWKLLVMGDIIW